MITGVAHICLSVQDLGAAEQFYVGQLGLRKAFEFHDKEGRPFGAYLHVGGRSFIELFKGSPVPAPESASFRHFCLEVDDFEKTVATLRKRGLNPESVQLGADRSWQAWLTDPDGNRIELHGYTAESSQTAALKGDPLPVKPVVL
jgi:catechol 2,3-dioxygenase-like lactoylglutathione lyase family enzyme